MKTIVHSTNGIVSNLSFEPETKEEIYRAAAEAKAKAEAKKAAEKAAAEAAKGNGANG